VSQEKGTRHMCLRGEVRRLELRPDLGSGYGPIRDRKQRLGKAAKHQGQFYIVLFLRCWDLNSGPPP
jgi:hypothetical protein